MSRTYKNFMCSTHFCSFYLQYISANAQLSYLANLDSSDIIIQKKKERDYMTEKEMIKISVEEFVQLQNYMLLVDNDSEAYKVMKVRYSALKVILTSSGVNLTEIDRIKEQGDNSGAMAASGKTQQEIASAFGISQQELSQRLKTGKFTQEEFDITMSFVNGR